MLTVGVAARLGRFPSEARAESFKDLALLAAYFSLEAEQLREPSGRPAATPRTPGVPHTTTQTTVFRVAPKKRK
jgi:hypothetical protein